MVLYHYVCSGCGKDFDQFAVVGTKSLMCPVCGRAAEKTIVSVPIVFKGDGFYSTDNKKSSENT
jgi:putative FmdB family regulatory protein